MPVRVPRKIELALAAAAICSSSMSSGQVANAASASSIQPGPPAAQTDSPDQKGADVVDVENLQERMTLPINIGGNGPYPFLIDSGAERTVISDELAARLSLAPGPNARVHDMSGATVVSTVIIPDIHLSRRRPERVNAPSLKRENIGAAGLLGLDMLKNQRVVLDFRNQTMTMSASSFKAVSHDRNTIVVNGRSRFGRLVLLDAAMDGEKIMVVLDTGSQVTIGNEALRQRLIAKKKFTPGTPAELISVTGGVLVAESTYVRSLRIGGVLMKEVPMAFAEAHPFKQLDLSNRPAILLGMDVLRMFNKVSVDFPNREVRFLLPDLSLWDPIRMAGAGGIPNALP